MDDKRSTKRRSEERRETPKELERHLGSALPEGKVREGERREEERRADEDAEGPGTS